ncbi:CDP-archaeol synthase [Candidatus Woesearchaeota archaeon]|nr:CDP-archaeol synthase [Candidatus Woesearchaeota archaeon]
MDFSLLQVLYFLFPVAIANMMPVFVKKVRFLNIPLDFRQMLWGQRILGSHKTWRGLFFGTFGGIIAALLQFYLYRYSFFQSLSLFDYTTIHILSFGFSMGLGVMIGDAIGSFFKRRLALAPGASFMPVDQIVGPLGAIFFIIPFYRVGFELFLACMIISFVVHLVVKYIGFLLKFERRKF